MDVYLFEMLSGRVRANRPRASIPLNRALDMDPLMRRWRKRLKKEVSREKTMWISRNGVKDASQLDGVDKAGMGNPKGLVLHLTMFVAGQSTIRVLPAALR